MTKKRQQDFNKVQLKPGRPLKRSNLPSVKFKSRKIVMPKERVIKEKSEYTIEDCTRILKNAVKAGSERDKTHHLIELNKLIHRHSGSLNTELSKIFESVLNMTRDPYDSVRNIALKILMYVLENIEDSHLLGYVAKINANISATMKNPSPKISAGSLILLNCMIKNHPDLIYQQMDILLDLLPTEKLHFTRQLSFEKGNFLYSETEEINNLGHINAFLKIILEKKNDFAKDEEDKDIYMDEKKTMSLVLYTSGGLKPIDIEEVYSKQFNPTVDPSDQATKLREVLNVLVRVIPGIFSRTIRCHSSADDNTLRSESIADLSIIAQVLCSMVEIAERISHTVAVEEIATILKEKVYSPYRKKFPFELLTILPGTSLEPLAMLNTSLCYLFMKFLFSNESSDREWQLIKRYLNRLFSAEKTFSSEIKCKCIPLFIKMIQLFNCKKDVPDVIFLLLNQLVSLLKTRVNHPNKKKLLNFLYYMSVTKEYEFWFESEPMELWFCWLLSPLKENNLKLDRKLMKMICKISLLKYRSFMKYLDFSSIKSLLKQRNDDLKETAIILLHNMKIDDKTFKNVYGFISQESFPRKFAVTLIRMLNTRFQQCSQSETIHIQYIEFLLNTAIGVYHITNKQFINLEDNRYAKKVRQIQTGHSYCIVPSLYWKEHCELFQACQTYLRNLPQEPVCIMFTKLVSQILHGRLIVPIHCVLAILKLDMDMPEISEKCYPPHLMLDLTFSCLMTTSVLTNSQIDDEWFKWNVSELMNSMSLTANTGKDILNRLLYGHFFKVSKPNGLVVYHTLRVLKFLIEKRSLNYECPHTIERILRVLTNLSDECSDETLRYQPLYNHLYDFFVNCL